MSMGHILKTVRDFLRSSLPATAAQCDLRPGGDPPETADEWFVAIDELGVKSTALNCLDETYEIEISVWRRAGALPADRTGDALLPEDPYAPAAVREAADRESSPLEVRLLYEQ